MQRSVIFLTALEQQQIQNYLQTSNATQDTIQKFSNIEADQKIELSREQVEQILDSLPVPTTESSPESKVLRQKITNFYQTLA